MGFSNNEQLQELFYAGGMGFLLGAYYDVFRILRTLLRQGKWAVLLGDCVFFSTSAVCVFLFSLAMTDGTVRGYVLLGILIGFTAYRYVVGKSVLRLAAWLLSLFRHITVWCRRVGAVPIAWLNALRGNVWKKCRKVLKKVRFFSKKGLHLTGKV